MELAETVPMQTASVQLLRVLGDRMTAAGLDAAPYFSQVQLERPASFLANLALANALRSESPAESMRYYQAALAIRPNSATAHNNLGVAFADLVRSDEAVAQYQRALLLDSKSAQIPHNLGLELFKTAKASEAIEYFERAIALAPTLADTHEVLGLALIDQQRYADAEAALSTSLKLLGENAPERPRIVELLQRCATLKSQSGEQPD
jgi:Tfp pilus assembly protein PilF